MADGQTVANVRVKIGGDMSPLKKELGKIETVLQPVRQRLRSVGTMMSATLTAPLVAFGTVALRSAAKMDSLKRGLTAVSGSAGEAEKQLERLREVAKLPGLGFEEAVQGSINLQAAGFSANTAERALRAFGNALATVGKGKAELDGVILALGQIASKGKVSAEEINQIAERVPQIRQVMKDAFGTADTEAIQKMGISTEQFVGAVITELEKLPPVTGGIQNALENLQDTASEAFRTIGEAIIPVASAVIDKLVPAIQAFVGMFRALPDSVKESIVLFAGLTAAIGPVALALSVLMTPVGLATTAIGVLGAAVYLIYDNWKGLPDFMSRIWEDVKIAAIEGVDNILMVLEKLTFGPFTSEIKNARRELDRMRKGMELTGGVWGLMTAGFTGAAEKIKDVLGQITAPTTPFSPTTPGALADEIKAQVEQIKEFSSQLRALKGPEGDRLAALELQAEALERQVNWARQLNRIEAVQKWAGDSGSPRPLTPGGPVMIDDPRFKDLEKSTMEFVDRMWERLASVRSTIKETAVELSYTTNEALAITAMTVDDLAGSIGGVIAGFEDLGKAVSRVMRNVVASITAAIAKALILKTLLTVFGGGTGFFSSIIRDVAGSAGITEGFGKASLALGSPPSMPAVNTSGVNFSVVVSPQMMSSGDILFAVQQAERRYG